VTESFRMLWPDGRETPEAKVWDIRTWYLQGKIKEDSLVFVPSRGKWLPLAEVFDVSTWRVASAALRQPQPLEATERPSPAVGSAVQTGLPDTGRAFPSAASRSGQRGNWFARHWRGDLPLGASYWVNGLLLTVVAAGAVTFVTTRIAPDIAAAPKTFSFLIIALWPCLTLTTVWQQVGIWRSSNKHVARNGKPFWANLAKLAVILGLLGQAATVKTTAIPQISEFWKILTGHDPVGAYQLRVLRNASELEISGAIAFGLSDDVAKILAAHPTIKIIHLNSVGGRINEARRLRGLIQSKQLSTYTATGCSSACVLPFLAGTRRLIASNTKLGFHQYAFPGVRSNEFAEEYARDGQYFISRGVSGSFVKRAFETPNAEMWTPSYEELLSAGVVTGQPTSNEVAISGLGLANDKSFEDGFLAFPIYRALKTYEPNAYSEVLAAARDTIQRGGTWGDLRAITHPVLGRVYLKRLPYAGDAEILSAIRLMLDEMAALYDKDPKLCYSYVRPDAGRSIDVAQYLPQDLAARELAVMADVISSSGSAPRRPMAAEQATVLMQGMFRVLGQRFGEKTGVIALGVVPEANQGTYCVVAYAMFTEILSMPPAQAASFLRYFFAK